MIRLSILFLLGILLPNAVEADETISFNRHIRPILAENCLACHGRDSKHREAELRLDTFDGATRERNGVQAIAPGDLAKSELWLRIQSDDLNLRMPPPHSNKPPLKVAERAALKTWIEQGAKYERHWSFEPPRRPKVNQKSGDERSQPPFNSIDSFVEEKLQQHGLAFAPEADHTTLVRRVALDLTGLPPSEELLSLPYEKAVDELLASKHFGEHMAVAWLDAARYADTNGYFGDKPRQMWLWRDWVIDAFNSNMPFDQFTIEQLAGDLLPNPTVKQQIATAFNRNHMANNETGIIDEEFRVEYVIDRVNTTMTVWQGLTAGCAQCHDHKFDPISQREYYQLFAFFNNVPEQGLIRENDPPPRISVPSPEQEQALKAAVAETRGATEAFEPMRKKITAQISEWEKEEANTRPTPMPETVFYEAFNGGLGSNSRSEGTSLVFEKGTRGEAARFDGTRHVESNQPGIDLDEPWTIGLWIKADGSLGCPLSLHESSGNRRGIEILWQKGRAQVNLVDRWGASAIEVSTVEALSSKNWHQLVVTYDGSRKAKGLRVFFDGRPTTLEVRRDNLSGTLANREPLRIGRRDSGLGFYGSIDEVRILKRVLDETDVRDWFWTERIRGITETPGVNRSRLDSDTLLDYYIDQFGNEKVQKARQRLKIAAHAEKALRDAIPTVLVMQEMATPRTTHVLERGQYNKLGELVTPDVPTAIAPWPNEALRNRLGFAKWLVSRENPLTARVAVNRLWQQCFGDGLVQTVDDFGVQGEPPTHPELLDWLAVTFRESGWDVKAILKRIVMSKTYRQQSANRVKSDPENRLLSRGPSGRLSAEMLRDQALAVSGLLVRKIGGPSVKPYQPPGLWKAVSYNGEETYVPDTDEGLWRRSLYTYVKRQAPPPILLTFDGPTREKCTVRRARTNTPLQALLLLNDPTFVEAARVLGGRTLATLGDDVAKLRYLWRRVLCRDANDQEVSLLQGLLKRQRERFTKNPAAAEKLLAIGKTWQRAQRDPGELAAWTVVAQTVFNLDEAITKR